MKNLWILFAVLILTACGGSNSSYSSTEGQRLIDETYQAKDYPRLVTLADSLHEAGMLSTVETNYWLGYAHDRMLQRRMAEYYWKSAIADAADFSDAADLAIYAKSASRLTNVLCLRGEYDEALKVASLAAERLEKLHCDTTSDYTNLLIYIGCCQSRDQETGTSFEQAWKKHQENIKKNHTEESYKNAIAGIVNIAYDCLETHHYEDALTWTARYAEFISQFEAWGSSRTDYIDKQWARYDIYRAIAFEGMGRRQEAASVYDEYLTTKYSQTTEGRIVAADYLVAAQRWKEAADSYQCLDDLLNEYKTGYSLENIQKMVLQRYNANVQAGLTDSANVVARIICDNLDAAISQARHLEAEELHTISQKEEQIALHRASVTRQRTIGLLTAIALIFLFFSVYTLIRRKSSRELAKAHEELKTAYGQLEESTRAGERIASELRLAHDIQQNMLPTSFPSTADVDVFAALLPSKEMGGDFYDFLQRDGKLFFCIGGVSGKGVQAAMVMASVKTWFRSCSLHQDQPSRIVEIINKEMCDSSQASTGISLFVGVLDLSSGRLYYSNAGHHAPILIGSGIGPLPAADISPIGMSADTAYANQEALIDPGTIIFLYTSGLIETENGEHKQFGQQRMAGEAMQTIHGLDPTPKAFVGRMTAAVNRFRGEAPQTGDLTMLAVRYLKKPEGVECQRSITLPNNPNELPRLQDFASKVCRAVKASGQEANEMGQILESTVAEVMEHVYGQGVKGDISIEAKGTQQEIVFCIRSNGKPYDLTAQTDGVAINKMRKYADSISYKHKGEQNVLTFTRHL